MAVIYSYPVKSAPANNDLILISDSADDNKTKQVKISDLPGGATAGVSSFNTLTGAVTISAGSNITLTPTGNDIEISSSGGGGAVSSVAAIAAGTSSGTPIVVTPTTGAVTIQSMAFAGDTNVGHVPDSSAAAAGAYLKADGSWTVPPDTNTTYSAATDSVLGLAKLEDATEQTETAQAVTSTVNRTYGIQNNGAGQLVVNVPWTSTTTNIGNSNLTLDSNRTFGLSTYSFQVTGDTTFRLSNKNADPAKVGLRVDHNIKCSGQAYTDLNDIGTSGGNVSVDWNLGNVQTIVLNANANFTQANANPGGTYILIVSQPAGQAYTTSWSGDFDWHNNNTAPGTITADRTDVYTFVCRTSTSLLGTYAEDFQI